MTSLGASPTIVRKIDALGYSMAVLGAVLFATKGVLIKLMYQAGVSVETALALRMITALPVFIAIGVYAVVKAPQRLGLLTPVRLLAVAAVGTLGYWFSSYVDFAGLYFVSAQYERLVLFTYPFLSFLLGIWFFRDAMNWRAVPGLVVSYVGLVVIFAWNLSEDPHGLIEGTVLVLLAALAYALFQHLAKRQMSHIGPLLFTCIGNVVAGAVAIGINAGQHGIDHMAMLPAQIWLYGLGLGLIGTVLPSFMINIAISRIGARSTAATGTYGPVMTIVLAVWILGEPFTLWHALGTALVIGGSILFGRAETRQKALPPAA
jgi:drug/metabolite transporter (DMT)-like permease